MQCQGVRVSQDFFALGCVKGAVPQSSWGLRGGRKGLVGVVSINVVTPKRSESVGAVSMCPGQEDRRGEKGLVVAREPAFLSPERLWTGERGEEGISLLGICPIVHGPIGGQHGR